jgi:mannose-1-phosphate guanylyltransferase / mannose-6-phosphate isomerase
MIFPVVLSGGSGSRLWPLSRTLLPKQFLPLVGKNTMLQDTLLRLDGIAGLKRPVLVCSNDHRFLAAEQLREISVVAGAQILEPAGRNTAPAVAVAALHVVTENSDGIMLVLPADHLIRDIGQFHTVVGKAAAAAADGRLVTFGIVGREPETGYGYIERGQPLEHSADCYRVARFVEKPDEATARQFVESGRFYWNSGMFVFKASRYLEELGKYRKDILVAAKAAWAAATRDLDFVRLDEKAFMACPSESIDYAVMEKTNDAVVVEADIGWSDIGSWTALSQAGKPDASGNVTLGDIHADNVRNCDVRAEHRLVAAVGVQDLIIVETSDAVLVTHKDHSQEVKKIVDALKAKQRDEYLVHKRVYRPWGYYEGLDSSDRFQVKRIMVKPGCKLSLQMHHHRAEH